MKTRTIIFLLALVSLSASAVEPVKVQCSGNTTIKLNQRIGAQTPFNAVFSIEGDTVRMIEGDTLRFAKEYARSAELESKNASRQAFTSESGNLFFYRESGRFELIRVEVVDGALKMEQTDGACEKFVAKNVFD